MLLNAVDDSSIMSVRADVNTRLRQSPRLQPYFGQHSSPNVASLILFSLYSWLYTSHDARVYSLRNTIFQKTTGRNTQLWRGCAPVCVREHVPYVAQVKVLLHVIEMSANESSRPAFSGPLLGCWALMFFLFSLSAFH